MEEIKKSKYSIEIGSPPDYEELVAYIIIEGQEVLLINQDNGVDDLKIEILENKSIKRMELMEFQDAISKATKILIGDNHKTTL